MRTLVDPLEFLLTVDRDDRVVHDASVRVEDDRIVDVGSAPDIAARHPRASIGRLVDGSHFGMVPGFVDSQVYLSGMLSRAPVTHTPTTEKIRA